MNQMNYSRIDLNLLPVFAAILEAGSVSMAAERLNLSQPAVSHALNRLRKLTGDPLFVRSGRKLTPTPRAAAMDKDAAEVLRSARALLTRKAFIPETSSARFRIGASDYASVTIVPDLLRRINKRSPASTVDILAVGADILLALESGKADVSFWGVAPPPPPFRSMRLFEERLIGVACDGHPLLSRLEGGMAPLKDYLHYPHAMVALGVTSANPVDSALLQIGQPRTVLFTGQSFIGNLHAMQGTDLIMSLPSRLLDLAQALGFCGFELPIAIPAYSYSMIWHSRVDADPAIMWLRQEIETLLRDGAER